MAQIGLAIAGRHPGFLVFTQINWPGPAPEDKDVHAMCSGESYISAILGPEWDTYELALCNFVSNSGRTEALRILLRVPHGYTFLNAQNQPVAPSYILHEATKMLIGNPVVHLGNTLRFAPGVIRPAFPEADLGALLGQFHIQPRWGGEITMRHASGHPQYVTATEENIPALIAALPHCTRLEDSSTVYFGPFKETAQPRFMFFPDELAVRFKVLVNVRRRNGSFVPRAMDGGAITINTRELDYSPQAYEDMQYTLTEAQVEAAYCNGDRKIATPPFVEATLSPEAGEVTLSFSPPALRKTFTVNVVDGDHRPLPLPDLLTTLESTAPIPVNPIGYTFIGEDIVSFERDFHDATALAAKFSLPPTSVYNIVGATLTGNVITVKVRRKAPAVPVMPPAPGPQNAETAPSAKTLTVVLPVGMNTTSETITVQTADDNASPEFYFASQVIFTLSPDGQTRNATIDIQLNLQTHRAKAFLGIPAREETQILSTLDGNYKADFTQAKKNGFFSRVSDLFAYRYENFVPGSWKIWRSLLPAVVGMVLMIAGIVIGVLMADTFISAYDNVLGKFGFGTAPAEQTVASAPTDSVVAETAVATPTDESMKVLDRAETESEEPIVDK